MSVAVCLGSCDGFPGTSPVGNERGVSVKADYLTNGHERLLLFLECRLLEIRQSSLKGARTGEMCHLYGCILYWL